MGGKFPLFWNARISAFRPLFSSTCFPILFTPLFFIILSMFSTTPNVDQNSWNFDGVLLLNLWECLSPEYQRCYTLSSKSAIKKTRCVLSSHLAHGVEPSLLKLKNLILHLKNAYFFRRYFSIWDLSICMLIKKQMTKALDYFYSLWTSGEKLKQAT